MVSDTKTATPDRTRDTVRNRADVTGPDTESDTDDTTAAQVGEALTAPSRALVDTYTYVRQESTRPP